MLEFLAMVIVVLAAIYLIGLAAVSFFAPAIAAQFLDRFASSAQAHFTEMAIRLVVGGSLVVNAPRMLFSDAFLLFGWVLVITTIILLLVPWRWHHRFAQKVVAPITRRVWLFGLVSFPLGGVILFAVLSGSA
jgi:hypothetical protein